jgi:midasin (ATPase involved in ribosome maturation)
LFRVLRLVFSVLQVLLCWWPCTTDTGFFSMGRIWRLNFSVEGLTAVLGHRRSVFVPELEQYFCAANGLHSPGAQKHCLRRWWSTRAFSRSFLNMFTRVIAESPSDADIEHISSKVCPTLPTKLVTSVVEALKRVKNGSAGLPSHSS